MAKEIEEIAFSWGVVLQIGSFIIAVVVIYFTQKARIDKLENQFDSYFNQNDKDKTRIEDEIEAIKTDFKTDFKDLKNEMKSLTEAINNQKIELINAINNKKK